eukprot:7262910-Prymnesium_polylepis.1
MRQEEAEKNRQMRKQLDLARERDQEAHAKHVANNRNQRASAKFVGANEGKAMLSSQSFSKFSSLDKPAKA